MNKIVLTLLAFILLGTGLQAQQDPMFTKYMFNSLLYNPAYAGAKDHMSVVALHRDQWWGIEGAPKTQTFTLHTPLESNRVGVGFSFYNDQIGPVNQMYFNGSYAYRIIFNEGTEKESKLALGVQASILNWRADWSQLVIQNMADEAFMGTADNMWKPNFGAGIYYYNKFWYLGLSVPHFINHELRDPSSATTQMIAQQFRHYFLAGGLAIPIGGTEDLIFKPSFTIKNTNLFGEFDLINPIYANVGAPTEFDVDVSMMFFKTIWVGASFRAAFEGFNGQSSFDSIDLWAAYYLRNGLRIGVAYDYTLTELRSPAQGSFELMLGYELNFRESTIVTPRYF